MTLAVCYLAGGLLYGLQCLWHIGQIAGVVRWPDLANLAFVIGITGSFLAILTWAILSDRKNDVTRRGPVASRALNAAFSAAGMANTAVIIVFGVGAYRDQDFAIWLYYAAIVFALQAAAWYGAWMLKRKGWMLAVAAGRVGRRRGPGRAGAPAGHLPLRLHRGPVPAVRPAGLDHLPRRPRHDDGDGLNHGAGRPRTDRRGHPRPPAAGDHGLSG